ncbi:MAG: autotransporter assembly complex protein TamA [Alphaproteobacteria bacterium]|nr:autotransporter assembly complex protein TamA [Alphaproteobacteria bacterium]MBU1524863.1 autotransporter assembly complex protein TamA [Alphaproteobacteria bacterium]MBU2117244.1 autotransporter assembly complex protein TamA [Alphaproteobacteria bacterium]MBU2350154.1 autotransporter assembly complex protein TamA [Alphaproteobacteria bacterium]MBU2381955.1 autotransporter assembly complex protein TamA [Alphaproteobacteria bacterium]
MPDELRAQLVQAVGESDGPPSNRFEARRRARAAAEDATALLRSEGYYQATVQDDVEGEETPVAVVVVVPGQRFVLATPTVTWTDEVPSPEIDQAARGELDLATGNPGRAIDVIAAEGRLVAALSRRGHADARATPRRVVVDHASLTVEPEYRIDAGPLVTLNGVRLETRGRTNPGWVDYLRPWDEGDVYDPEQVAELERRLLETGVYDGVGVALAPAEQATRTGDRPVIVTLADRPRRILEVGATVSTGEGAGVDAIWTHHNRFGRADTLRFQARIANIDSRIGTDLSLPHWRRPGRTLTLSGAVVNEDTDAYVRTALTASADLRQRIGRTSYFTYGVGLDAGQYKENRFDRLTNLPIGFDRDLVIVTGRGSAYTDASNDPLDPTRGWRLFVSAQPTAVAGEDTVLFVRAEAQVSAYLPLQDDARTVLAGRVRIGSILGGDELTVPSDRLFYSGGGGSVRGYSYQGVGPRLPDNTPRGGLSLFETSIEARHRLRGALGLAAFVDAGAIGFEEYPDFGDVRFGAGIGVRYDLPFGPIRADIAFPLNKRDGDADFQIYVSIGQAF